MSGSKTTPTAFLSVAEKQQVEQAIAAAERRTSAEIRVVIARSVAGDVLEEAKRRFARLKMHETRDRNGVIVFLATRERRFAIYGDEGIHRFMGQEGWDGARDEMAAAFRRGEFAAGLAGAVTRVGEVLAEHFPWREDDVNELPDEIVEE